MKRIIIGLMAAIFLLNCSEKKSLTPEELRIYEAEVNTWHAKRIENLKRPDGWLNLVGLHWLNRGISTFGSDEKSNIVFPKGKIAEHVGYFIVEGPTVSIHTTKEAAITKDGKPVTEQIIFHADSSHSAVLKSGSLQWTIIKRDDKVGIRLRDLDSELQKTFKGIDRFPVDPSYRVEAVFKKSDSTHTIPITNVLGQTTEQSSPGALAFTLEGNEYQLDVLDGGKEEFFVIFADATSGKETYAGGRFLYVKRPGVDGMTIIDFNKAYNPPCVFTPYATCPLPPKQNKLAIAVNAGEKNYSHEEKATASLE